MKNITYILFSLVMLQGTFSAAANNTLINAKMDSTLLLMGKKTAIHVEVVQDKGQKGFFVNEGVDTLNAFVEVSERLQADTTDLGNDRIQINRDIIVQSFD